MTLEVLRFEGLPCATHVDITVGSLVETTRLF